MAKLSTVQVGSRSLDIHCFSGEVMESQKWTTTQISGGGGGGFSHNGTGYSSNAPVTSRTTTHDQIFVKAPDGEERALELTDVHLAVRRGQWLSLLWAIRSGKNEGPYVAVLNHNTGSVDFVAKAVNDSCGPPFYNLLLVIAVFAGVGGVGGIFSGALFKGLLFAGPAIGYIYWLVKRRKAFKAELSLLAERLRSTARPPATSDAPAAG